MRNEKKVLDQLKNWTKNNDNIRSLVLTSSRADSHRKPDILSDYDVEVYVKETGPFVRNDGWLKPFGPIMVRWPSKPQPTFDQNWITQLVQFEDGVRIDFQITTRPPATSPNLDFGYKVIMDKDKITQDMPAPSYAHYKIDCPSSEEFNSRIEAFWWDIIYVAKALRRGELNYAKYMMESIIRFEKLHPIMNWYIGLHHNWSVNTGMYGRWFHQYLDGPAWKAYEQTFAGADMEGNWQALFATLDFFRKLTKTLANELKFKYPESMDKKVTDYIHTLKK